MIHLLQGMARSGSISGQQLLQFGRLVTVCDLTAGTVMQTIPPTTPSATQGRSVNDRQCIHITSIMYTIL